MGKDRRKDKKSPSASYSYSDSESRSRSRSRGRKGKSKDRGRGGRSRDRGKKRSRSSGRSGWREDLKEFIRKNRLGDRVQDMLDELGEREAMEVMGITGGKNTFILDESVRNPDAVVVSRIRRVQGGGGRPPPRRNDSRGR
eukprot:TRINITY_DN4356_c0_g8_i1.p1 TRINITY_DN4356_c0_g8~~TRINITY_DN4356_c0_g8_i1.p1  ORF type:complete len:141 (-),score=20.79 TRINITY_DN4356_c0_g8_i1:82-504(-)